MTGASPPHQARLAQLVASLDAAVLVEDEARRIVLTNQAFCDLFGVPAPPEALVGADCSNAAEQHKAAFADPERFVARVQEILRNQERVLAERWTMADGRELERDYVPIEEAGGHFWVYRDITARVRDERAKDEFIALLSHEVRNPTATISGISELLLAAPLDDASRGLVRSLAANARGLVRLLDDVLDVAELERGRVAPVQAPFEIGAIVAEALEGIVVLAAQKGLRVYDLTPRGLPRVRGDASRLGQVLVNLLGNAVKFTDEGAVSVDAWYEHGRLGLRVQDSGPGIAAEARAAIFEPFQQGGRQVRVRYGGRGLGLGLARRLVEAMQGTLRLESVEGEGTTFEISVPAAEDQRGPPPHGALRGLTVSLQSTSPAWIAASETWLRGAGAEVGDGPDALPVAEADVLPPDARLGRRAVVIAPFGALDDAALAALGGPVRLHMPVRGHHLVRAVAVAADRATSMGTPDVGVTAQARIFVVDETGGPEPLLDALGRLGYAVDLFEDGVAAVERAELAPPAWVLARLQSPGLDAFALAARLSVPVLGIVAVDSPEAQATGRAHGLAGLVERRASRFRALEQLGRALDRPRVLVVDDDDAFRAVAARRLHQAGWLPLEASGVDEAKPAFTQAQLSGVVTDLSLADAHAAELLAWGRADSPQPDLRWVALTADAAAAAAAPSWGFDAGLVKPATAAALDAALGGAPGVEASDAPPSPLDPDTAAVLPIFLEHRQRDLEALGEALDAGEVGAAQAIGHRLAGSAVTFGLAGLAEAARRLEAAGRRGDLEAARRAADEARAGLTEVAAALPRAPDAA